MRPAVDPCQTVRHIADHASSAGQCLPPVNLARVSPAGSGCFPRPAAVSLAPGQQSTRAGLHPEQRAHELTLPEVARLHEAINFVIDKGICGNGTTFRDYLDGIGNKGEFQNDLCVYGRKNLPCPACGTLIVRTEVGGRGTHFCPQCQPERK